MRAASLLLNIPEPCLQLTLSYLVNQPKSPSETVLPLPRVHHASGGDQAAMIWSRGASLAYRAGLGRTKVQADNQGI